MKERPNFELISRCPSPAMRNLVKDLPHLARSRIVMVNGPTGAGKELVARAIHELGPRSDKPLITIDCTLINSGTSESDLFGHEKGAYTGAGALHMGHFEMAHGGTVFLDEIAELPLLLQQKLLRVLDGYPFYRVGGSGARMVRSNFHLIAATNANLPKLVSEKLFREDLWWRLDQVDVLVPGLPDRRADIVSLADHFSGLEENECCVLDAGCHGLLETHSWPGNVRELRNKVMRAKLFAHEQGIILPRHFRIQSAPSCQGEAMNGAGKELGENLEAVVTHFLKLKWSSNYADFMRDKFFPEVCRHLLATYGGDVQAVGRRLRISNANLYPKIRLFEKLGYLTPLNRRRP